MISEKESSKLDYLIQALVNGKVSSEKIISLAYRDELIAPSDEFKSILEELGVVFKDKLDRCDLKIEAESLINSKDKIKITIGYSILGALKF